MSSHNRAPSDRSARYGVINSAFSNDEEFEMAARRAAAAAAVKRPLGPDCLPPIDETSARHPPELIHPVSFLSLFRLATNTDVFLVALALVAAIGAGVCFPLMTINFSFAVQSMIYAGMNATQINGLACSNTTSDNRKFLVDYVVMNGEMKEFTINMSIIGLCFFILGTVFVVCLNITAENQVIQIRSAFFKGLLRQDAAWFDRKNTNDFASRITEDLNKIQDGIGEKIGMFLVVVSSYLAALTIAFMHGWLFTLVMMVFAPLMSLAIALASNIQSALAKRELKACADSGRLAEEVLSSIRTVVAYEGQDNETQRFQSYLETGRKAAVNRALATACIAAIVQGFPFLTFALGFWYGSTLMLSAYHEGTGYSVADVLIVFFCALGGSTVMGTIAPYLETFAAAQAAAASVFQVVDRIPQIDIYALKGFVPKALAGRITFQKVFFNYPARPSVPVLNGITFDVFPGQTVAVVGEPGCGKSTVVHLIQRFYDPQKGYVALDGQKLQDLSVNWLRSQIGVVSQESCLFAASIADNIKYGREDVTQAEIERAAIEANAYEFVQRLPNKFRTVVGDGGVQLSAGQKQRIAIARALVRNPRILLFDEATSALDGHSELVVQRALDKARKERTVIVVSRRLSTVRNADRIIVIKHGIVAEEGTHDRLLAKRGAYYELSVAQQQNGPISDRFANDDHWRSCPFPSIESHQSDDSQEEKAKAWLYDDDDDFLDATSTTTGSLAYGTGSVRISRRFRPTFTEQSDTTAERLESKVRLIDLLRMNKREAGYIAAGILASVLVGLNTPVSAFLLGEMLTAFVPHEDCDQAPDAKRDIADLNALLFLACAFVFALAAFVQSFCFSVAGESLTCRLRDFTFKAIVKQDVAWFDHDANKVGALCARLSGDAAAVQGGTGQCLGLIFQALSTLLACLVLAFYYEWKLGFVAASAAPVLFAISYAQAAIIKKQTAIDQCDLKESVNVVSEAVRNVRTVMSLGQQKLFHKMYLETLRSPHRAALKNAWIRGGVYGLANSLPMFAYATTMYYGSTFTASGLAFQSIVKVAQSLTSGMQAIGQAFAFAPNYCAAKMAAGRIFALIIRETPNVVTRTRDEILGIATGDVDFDRVHFRYPTRPHAEVLRGLSFSVKAGQTVALVGPSGAGKSTCIQLIQRFYDPNLGEVRMDFLNLKHINTKSLRGQIAVVSREPVLFNRTIRENIAYGDMSRKIPMEEIIDAARKANVHAFVQSLPNGYDTMVGDRGTQLSVGQKQRIAVARALVRNPSVLLLDEPTSSLDSENEKLVQMALDRAREGRTCITIAHRLSTIRDADNIIVLKNGKIEEQGTHDELMKVGGVYAGLCSSLEIGYQPSTNRHLHTQEKLL